MLSFLLNCILQPYEKGKKERKKEKEKCKNKKNHLRCVKL